MLPVAPRWAGWIAAGLLAMIPAATPANNSLLSPEEYSRALSLYHQLGDQSYKVREAASAEIVRYGRAVEPILRDGLNNPNPEIRSRCRRLLPLAMHYHLEKDIAAFLADKEDKNQTMLAGWARFKELVGKDDLAKELFISMHRFDTEFMETLDQKPADLSQKLSARCQEFMYQRNINRNSITAAQLGLLLFAVQDPKVNIEPQAASFFSSGLFSLSYQPHGKELMRDNTAIRKLLIQFVTNSNNHMMMFNNMYLIANLELKEGVDIAKRIIQSSERDPYTRAMAIGVLGKVGSKDNIPDLLPFLDKKDSVGSMMFNNTQINTQMRDVALAALVQLSGQKLSDYSFAYIKMFANANVNIFMSPGMLGFSDDAARDASIKKWKDGYEKEKGKK
ncbi:MAG TPA: hypothetical protein VKS79_04715 [Gemmataceae bacterium]|nr:hypothetical protein [Gemmataceae bacterium]